MCLFDGGEVSPFNQDAKRGGRGEEEVNVEGYDQEEEEVQRGDMIWVGTFW